MRRIFLLAFLACLTLSSFARNKSDDSEETGKVVGIVRKVHERTLYYQGNDPITKDEPYYEISILVKDTIYTGEYVPPQFGSDSVAEDWKIDGSVFVRTDKHHIYARPPKGRELSLPILKKTPASTIQNVPNPAP